MGNVARGDSALAAGATAASGTVRSAPVAVGTGRPSVSGLIANETGGRGVADSPGVVDGVGTGGAGVDGSWAGGGRDQPRSITATGSSFATVPEGG